MPVLIQEKDIFLQDSWYDDAGYLVDVADEEGLSLCFSLKVSGVHFWL